MSRAEAAGDLYSPDSLKQWIAEAFQAAGVDSHDSFETARILVRTSLRGIDTHGVARVLAYIDKIRSGEVNPRPKRTSAYRDGVLFYDADGGLGQAAATDAVRRAVEIAEHTSVVTCFVRGSGHLAAIGQIVLEAAEHGMIALICQETPPVMALQGWLGPAIGNNPLAFAFPIAGRLPAVFDIATSVVARGNIAQAIRDHGTAIPEGWAIGPNGAPTTDPTQAIKGAMLPLAGHKGIGLAMLVQVLAGSLTASHTAESAATYKPSNSAGNVSAFLLVLNPDLIIGRQAFDDHVATWLRTYLNAAGDQGRYPGQRAAECEEQRSVRGIPLSPSILAELRLVGEKVGLPFTVLPTSAGSSAPPTFGDEPVKPDL
jgi:LDH2 family malate/lactate/ureidoglycolate dehydrogenase